MNSPDVYTDVMGRKFRFGDHVCMELTMGLTLEQRTGLLVQVRKDCGQFGSDIYFIRRRDGSLATFENAMMRHVGDEIFERSFYRSNGSEPPAIPPQPVNAEDEDAPDAEYTMRGADGNMWPETGFIIEGSRQPQLPGSFAVTIMQR